MKEHYAVNGLAVNVTVGEGGRPPQRGGPLLLLHGFTGSAASWGDLLSALGAGRTTPPPPTVTTA